MHVYRDEVRSFVQVLICICCRPLLYNCTYIGLRLRLKVWEFEGYQVGSLRRVYKGIHRKNGKANVKDSGNEPEIGIDCGL